MVAPEIVVETRIEFPSLKLDKEVTEKILKVGEGAILDNIIRQKQASGAPLQANKPSTQERKAKKGTLWRGRSMSLIDENKRFIQGRGRSFKGRAIDSGKTMVIEPTNYRGRGGPSVKQLTNWLQVPSKGRQAYTGWFGLSKKHVAAIKRILRDWVNEQLRKSARRRR